MNVPDLFAFPFPPYDIQEDFMKNLYKVLTNGGVGIFESPTGTVSLSVTSPSPAYAIDEFVNRSKSIPINPLILEIDD